MQWRKPREGPERAGMGGGAESTLGCTGTVGHPEATAPKVSREVTIITIPYM